MTRKLYYLVGSRQVYTPGGGGRPHRFSSCRYNKKTVEAMKKERERDYPDYIFWIGWQWKGPEGISEAKRLPEFLAAELTPPK